MIEQEVGDLCDREHKHEVVEELEGRRSTRPTGPTTLNPAHGPYSLAPSVRDFSPHLHKLSAVSRCKGFAQWGFSERLCQKRSRVLKNALVENRQRLATCFR